MPRALPQAADGDVYPKVHVLLGIFHSLFAGVRNIIFVRPGIEHCKQSAHHQHQKSAHGMLQWSDQMIPKAAIHAQAAVVPRFSPQRSDSGVIQAELAHPVWELRQFEILRFQDVFNVLTHFGAL